ncbi:MAG: methylated-DNA--[protein]-cysteine S-methyltransferase [Porticoccus sp.]|nr:methylated-DNA--[protein]-cysteine S-methyltransferase [Porticoccus sp.]MBQ0807431.1 methylated-DNA--[protein]-cysteine S-methyltransferase [Porticoccus sp.]
MSTDSQCAKLDIKAAPPVADTVFIQCSPGSEKTSIYYGCSESPFGKLWMAWTDECIIHLVFEEEEGGDPTQGWGIDNPAVECHRGDASAEEITRELFQRECKKPLALQPTGTSFQCEVWQALLKIPSGTVTTYSDIAHAIGRPKSVRAVANAVGANPIAWLIPCHRVIRRDGSLGGYRWGISRKQEMLDWENI